MALIYLITNLVICFLGARHAKKIKSLFLFWWGYILYYAILYFLNSNYETNYYIEWFSYNRQNISIDSKIEYYGFFTITNLIILIAFKFFKTPKKNKSITIPKNFGRLPLIYSILMIISFIFLLNKMASFSYNDLTSSVDFGGWSWVFVQISMSLIVIAYFKKSKFLLALIMFFSLVYTILFFVRSVFIYSVLSMIFLYMIEKLYQGFGIKTIFIKLSLPFLILAGFSSLAITLRGIEEFRLPDSKLVDYSFAVYNDYNNRQGLMFNDFTSYIRGTLSPISKFIGKEKDILTTPVSNARILFTGDVYDVNFESFFHYPALFYNQFYSSFKWWGSLLGALLVIYVMLLERFVTKNFLTLFLFLPIFSWHVFMVFRGALDLSTAGISYALWINLIIYFIIKRNKFLYARFTSNK